MNPGFKNFIKRWIITAFAVLVAVTLLPKHLHCEKFSDLLIAALLLGLLNAFIRPFMLVLALPLLLLTLGLFTIVINAGLLYLVHALMGERFVVDGFGWAMLGAIIISLVSVPLNILTGSTSTRVNVKKRPRPPDAPDRGDSGGGPVIDV